MLTKSLDEARNAYFSGDISKNPQHTQKAPKVTHLKKDKNTKKRLQKGGPFLKSAVYGGLDGMITTYSVAMGASGASLGIGTILILGIANMIGDGISMALGDYVSTKSEREFQISERKKGKESEKWEVENHFQKEKEQMVDVYVARGLNKTDAQLLTDIISKNKEAFVDIMVIEELGLVDNEKSAGCNALITFLSFILFGLVPILPYIVSRIAGIEPQLLLISTVLTCLSLFSLGAIKTIFTMGKWYWSGLETLLIGSFAAAAAYFIGAVMEPLAN
jgi:vacuolar iron transporter family protein